MGEVPPNAALLRRLTQALAVMSVLMAGPGAADHCPTTFCEHEGGAPEPPPLARPERPPDPVHLGVSTQYVNDWATGYDDVRHTYRHAWLEEVLFDAEARPIRSACVMAVTDIEQTLIEDFGDCGSVQARLAPPGVTAIRWRLQDNGGPAGQVRILDEIHPGTRAAPTPHWFKLLAGRSAGNRVRR